MSVARACRRFRRKLKNDPRYKRAVLRAIDKRSAKPVGKKVGK